MKIGACWCKSDICITFSRSKNPQIRFCFTQIGHLRQNLEPFDFLTRGRNSGKITAAVIFQTAISSLYGLVFLRNVFCFGVEFRDLYIGAGGLRSLFLNFFASHKSLFFPFKCLVRAHPDSKSGSIFFESAYFFVYFLDL